MQRLEIPLTREVKVTGIWSSHDIGKAIDELIVHGQVNGGIVQSLGYAGYHVPVCVFCREFTDKIPFLREFTGI